MSTVEEDEQNNELINLWANVVGRLGNMTLTYAGFNKYVAKDYWDIKIKTQYIDNISLSESAKTRYVNLFFQWDYVVISNDRYEYKAFWKGHKGLVTLMEKQYLSDEEVNNLVKKAKAGDNEVWTQLYENFTDYIEHMVDKRIRTMNVQEKQLDGIREDLIAKGWVAFVEALKTYDPEHASGAKLTTYLYMPINGAIGNAIETFINPLGLTNRPAKLYVQTTDTEDESIGAAIAEKSMLGKNGLCIDPIPTKEKYTKESTTLQIMEVLRLLTDEKKSLSQKELFELLQIYRVYKNNGKDAPLEDERTLRTTIKNILREVNPPEYSEENESKFKIKYEGYKENRLQEGKKGVTNFSYVHTFSNRELNLLIEQVCFSDMISTKTKSELIEKLISTASVYFKSPFWDRDRYKLRFNPKAVHGRLDSKYNTKKTELTKNIAVLQQALNHLVQVKFRFNGYDEKGDLVTFSDYEHTLSPYHLVVYHDNFYCIGLKKGDQRIWHYRVDLMTDVEIIKNDKGRALPIELNESNINPISNDIWDPEKYMSEHLYMAYDAPRDILIKIKDDDYTMLHDWFGNHYEKTNKSAEAGYDIVKIKSSPAMIVHWAMQYAGKVEILDEDIREKLRQEIDKISKLYCK